MPRRFFRQIPAEFVDITTVDPPARGRHQAGDTQARGRVRHAAHLLKASDLECREGRPYAVTPDPDPGSRRCARMPTLATFGRAQRP